MINIKKTNKLILVGILMSFTILKGQVNNIKIIDLNTQTFKQKVWNFDKDKTFKRVGKMPIILDFHATWCRPCKMLTPHLQAIQNKYKGRLVIYRIDVDKEPQLAQRFNEQAMPTVVFIGSKTKYKSELGYREYIDIEKLVETYFFAAK